MSDVMAELRELARQLNEESDAVSKEVKAFEETLVSLNLGVEAWTKIPSGPHLGYVKRSGRWGLALDDVWLIEARRTARAEAIKYLPNLMTQLKMTAQYELRLIRTGRGVAGS